MSSILRKPLVFLDVETTGLDPNEQEIVEIALIREEIPPYSWMEPLLQVYTTKIFPTKTEGFDPKAIEVNGYDPVLWKGSPTFKEIAPEILRLLKGGIVVGHNVSFDVSFVNSELKRSGLEDRVGHRNIDTITLAFEHLVPLGLESLSLDSVRKFLGWSLVGAHRAFKDTEDCRRLFHLLRGGLGRWESIRLISSRFFRTWRNE